MTAPPVRASRGASIDDLFAGPRHYDAKPARGAGPASRRPSCRAVLLAMTPILRATFGISEPAYAQQDAEEPAPQHQDAYGNEAYAQDYHADARSIPTGLAIRTIAPAQKPRSRQGRDRRSRRSPAPWCSAAAEPISPPARRRSRGRAAADRAANNEPTGDPAFVRRGEIRTRNADHERTTSAGGSTGGQPEEQPVDVQQAVRMNGNAVADATGGTVPGDSVKPQQTASLEPRRAAKGPHRHHPSRQHRRRRLEPPAALPGRRRFRWRETPCRRWRRPLTGLDASAQPRGRGEHAGRGDVHPGRPRRLLRSRRLQARLHRAGRLAAAGRTCCSRDDPRPAASPCSSVWPTRKPRRTASPSVSAQIS